MSLHRRQFVGNVNPYFLGKTIIYTYFVDKTVMNNEDDLVFYVPFNITWAAPFETLVFEHMRRVTTQIGLRIRAV